MSKGTFLMMWLICSEIKGGILEIFFFSMKTYVVGTHKSFLNEYPQNMFL